MASSPKKKTFVRQLNLWLQSDGTHYTPTYPNVYLPTDSEKELVILLATFEVQKIEKFWTNKIIVKELLLFECLPILD